MTALVHNATRLIGKGHTMIHTHGQSRILLLEDTAQLNQIGTTAQVRGLSKVAIGEDVARTQVNEVCARGKLLRQLNHIVISACRERTSTEGESVMLVGNSIQEPLDILLGTNDTWQAQNLDRGIVGVNTHVHVALLANRHDSLEEVLHVGTQLSLVDAFIQIEELAELLYRSLVVLAEVTAYESLSLNHDILNQLVVLLGCHGLSQLVALSNHAATFAPSLGELELLPFLASTWTLQDINVEISKFGIVEIEVSGTVGVVVEQVGASPV